jgi:hypothetical protein
MQDMPVTPDHSFGTPLRKPPSSSRFVIGSVLALYACATLQFIRYYIVTTSFYLNLTAYLSGHERLPFQERVLPIAFIDLLYRLPWFQWNATHSQGAFTHARAPVYVIALISMVLAGYFTQKLYGLVTKSRALWFLVYPLFLFSVLWTYSMHLEANYSYPYDILSVAFFSAGLYFIFGRRFVPLLLVILIGTFNRETTLFLIGIYALDAMSTESPAPLHDVRRTFSLENIRWPRFVLLLAIWSTIHLMLKHVFAHNSHAEDYVRIRENIGRLKPRLWPALLNMCGYLLPLILLFRDSIRPIRFRNYLWIVPLWFAVMFYTGVIVETRIFGELCSYATVAVVLIMERSIDQLYARQRAIAEVELAA